MGAAGIKPSTNAGVAAQATCHAADSARVRGLSSHTGAGQGGIWGLDPWPHYRSVHCRAHSAQRGGLYPGHQLHMGPLYPHNKWGQRA